MSDLNELAEVLRVRVKRGADGEPLIEGRRGNAHQDGAGFSIFAWFLTAKGLKRCKAAFASFARLRQEGDTEGVWHMPTLPTPEQARLIRYWLRVPKRRQAAPGTAERLWAYRFTRRTAHIRRPDSTIFAAPASSCQPLENER
jgi:hypothetical protein